jgi:DNA-nicking Smr family endonuclease
MTLKARHLTELAAIRKALLDAQRAAEQAAALERERIAREHVAPPARKPRPPAAARQRERDEAAVMLEAISDEFDVQSLLDTDDALSYRGADIGPEVVRKLRRGVWAIQAQLDLHGLRREEARERLNRFVHDAKRAGLRCVRVIHGKGNGSPGREPVLKRKVQTWLVQKKEVIAFTQARASDGGNGALLVLLGPGKSQAR